MISVIPYERHEYIIRRVKQTPIYIADLAKEMNVSEITVRRDIKQLEEKGFIELKYGGLATIIDTTKETSMNNRKIRYVHEKTYIADIAVSLIEEGDIVFIDSGSTTQLMFERYPDIESSVFTNGLSNANVALERQMNVTVIGGDLKRETMAMVGPLAIEAISKIHFDKVFLGTNALDAEHGIMNADQNESLLKSWSIKHSREAFVLADSSKFNQVSPYKFAEIDDVTVITDKIPEKYKGYGNIIDSIQK
ncbi:DeoR/GlpR transcriptional regulator [Oceanobacillus piezotolerans]|uniref:DeoR/GlpR transcriptional regulator n=1 Tax=Oceanobacillus piezotolerans TaxID=2448030 RepID=A0A498DGB5_9BACI|nr:DeoR/GlpR family DNA-binding transcription regulator [Oceanobacillus piezotolerans]RLL46981.1 DeoR/GlpR transcriptional regulator [Oceanobacillus piezotolerans]